jgi:hypothetical protein
MNLLVEADIVDDHVVDGGLVDEHVVDGLVDDHEVVADRQGSLGKRSKILFLFVMASCVFMLARFIVAVSAGRCPASTLTATHPSLQICSKCAKSQSVLTKIRRKRFSGLRKGRWGG